MLSPTCMYSQAASSYSRTSASDGSPVLDQVDALLVVLDRLLALALVRQPGADLAVQLGDVLEPGRAPDGARAPLPQLDRRVDAAEPQRHVAALLSDRALTAVHHRP